MSKKIVIQKKGARKYKKNKMLAPSQLRNFINDNTLQDWLERYHEDHQKIGTKTPRIKGRDFQTQFRDHVIGQLCTRLSPGELIELERPDTTDLRSGEDMAKLLNGKETLKHMKAEVPVIANAQLVNRSEGLCDIADLLVRSDYISTLFPLVLTVGSASALASGCQYSSDWHYVVVGIRFGQNQFCVDGVKLRNDPSIRYWKTKLLVQNRILGYYQQSEVDYALMVGRGHTWTLSKAAGGTTIKGTSFDKPGVILFKSKFDYFTSDMVNTGTTWLNKLDAPLSAEWKTSPKPSVPELYANGKISVYDSPWAPIIHDIAVEQDDITLLHHCTSKHRQRAHDKGMYRLSSLTKSEDVGHKSTTKVGGQIGRYIDHKWSEVSDIPLPTASEIALYLDFESLPVGNVKHIDRSTYVNEWIYLANVTNQDGNHLQLGLTTVSTLDHKKIEREIAKGLWELFESSRQQDMCFSIFCWSDAEARYLYKLEEKYPEYPLGTQYAYRLINLHETFVQEEIILPGQTDNTLETVSRVMGLSQKIPINTNSMVQNIVWNAELSDSERQGMLDQLLEYNRNDTSVLREMVQKIHNEREQLLKGTDTVLERASPGGNSCTQGYSDLD